MAPEEQLLEYAEQYLREHVAPQAQEIDRDPDALGEALRGLCERNLMALRRPVEYGGPALGEAAFRRFQESVARASGALAFLQTQHQSAAAMLARSENEGLKQAWLPAMADGAKLMGIGFSQLRRPGEPLLRAAQVEGGYRLDGHVPWVTGHGFFPEFLVGAQLPDGQAVFGVVPLEAKVQKGGGVLRIGPVMRLAAMESAQTVTADLEGWFLPEDQVAFLRPAGWIHTNDMINITLQGFFALGCARAGLDMLRQAYKKRGADFLKAAWDALDAEVGECREAMASAQRADGERTTEEKLKLRAWAIDLAVRCAHAGVAASAGAANSADHPAQRIYREALVYTVSAQTAPIMEATLARIVGRRSIATSDRP